MSVTIKSIGNANLHGLATTLSSPHNREPYSKRLVWTTLISMSLCSWFSVIALCEFLLS